MALKNGEKRNKIMFYSDSYGRDMPLSLSKNNVDTSVFGEVKSGLVQRT